MWKKLKANSKIQKQNTHFLKFASIISEYYRKTILSQSFRKLQVKASTLNDSYSNKLVESRKVLLLQALQRIHKKWTPYSFSQIRLEAIKKQKQRKSVKSLNVLSSGLIERNKLRAWNKISAVPSGEHKDL